MATFEEARIIQGKHPASQSPHVPQTSVGDMQFLTKTITTLSGVLLVGQGTAAYTAKQIYQFPNSPFTDIENVAIRPNGQLVLSIITSPSVYTLDPSQAQGTAVHLHDFTGVTSCLGITEIASDEFAIAVGNVSTATYSGVPGTFSIYKIDFTKSPTAFTKIAAVPQAKILNGLTHVASNPSIILAADSEQGIIYSINAITGAISAAIQSSAFAPTASFPLGVNGIHTSGNNLYYSNSALGTYGVMPINANGQSAGSATVLAHDSSGNNYDDFALAATNNAFVTNHPSSIAEITPAGAQTVVVNDTNIVQPTSAIFSLDGKTIYVVTGGSARGSSPVSGQVFALTSC